MNIWIINHTAIPPSLGSQNRHYYFSKYLSAKGHTVKIITASTIHNTAINMISGKKLWIEETIDGIPYTFVKTHNYKKNGIMRIFNLLEFPFNIWRVLKYFPNPDVVYTSSPDIFAAFSSLIYAKKKRIKCVVEIRDLWPESIVEYMKWSVNNPVIKILYHLEKWIYCNANQLIFTMEGGLQYITDKGWESKITPTKIHNVNNGIDIKEFDYNLAYYTFQDDDLDNKFTYKIIYTGSIRKANNLKQILDCARLLKEIPEIIFLIYGTGTEIESLSDYCSAHKISNVKFKGRIHKKYIPYVLSKGNVNLINYMQTNMFQYGGSQNKLFEYLASGRPVISNIKQGYCLINRYKCGISRALLTPEQYATAILEMYHLTDDKYQMFCHNARNTALLFDYSKLANLLENILLQGDLK